MAATVATRIAVVEETVHTRQRQRSLKVLLLRPKLTVEASTSARQRHALATALGMVAPAGIQEMCLANSAETTLRSSQ
jgi:hypothetical protein